MIHPFKYKWVKMFDDWRVESIESVGRHSVASLDSAKIFSASRYGCSNATSRFDNVQISSKASYAALRPALIRAPESNADRSVHG
jgi:hypothetical protein